jgi:hypothetical protein
MTSPSDEGEYPGGVAAVTAPAKTMAARVIEYMIAIYCDFFLDGKSMELGSNSGREIRNFIYLDQTLGSTRLNLKVRMLNIQDLHREMMTRLKSFFKYRNQRVILDISKHYAPIF